MNRPSQTTSHRRLTRNGALLAGLIGLAAAIVLAIIGPMIWGGEATALGGAARQGPSEAHWLGTDALGRDVLARTMTATRLTLVTTAIATALAAVIGILLGAVVAMVGRRLRELGLRIIDLMMSYPSIILALLVVTIIGAGPTATVVAIGIAGSPSFARMTSNLAISISGREFITATRLVGVSPWRMLTRHLLPNMAEPLLVLVSVAFATILVALSGLSFLGLGVQPPQFDWGSLLGTGLTSLYTNPAEALAPAVAIALTGLAAGLVGEGLAAAQNPRTVHHATPEREPTHAARPEKGRTRTAPSDAVLHVRDLTVTRGDGHALVDGIDLDIRSGEVVGIVGESGSGKSVTAMAIARLLQAGLQTRASALRLGSLDLLDHPDARQLATQIGIVYQDPSASFNPALKMGGQLTEALRVHLGRSRSDARTQAVDALNEVHVSQPGQRLDQYPFQLSGGMRQRAMIASAMLTEPELLIADEPTTALDVTVQADVLRLLRRANTEQGTSILFISHDIAVVSELCDRVLVMYAGRIVEELSIDQVTRGEARHPYTRALLAAAPTMRGERNRLAAIPGRPPQPDEMPGGCGFAPRCPIARTICHQTAPALRSGLACHAQDWVRTEPIDTDERAEPTLDQARPLARTESHHD